jgi:hypothetical protein
MARNTASFCREQAAVQQARALSEPLASQRRIAQGAAKAWLAEAALADQRSTGQGPFAALDAQITQEFADESEQPDDPDDQPGFTADRK